MKHVCALAHEKFSWGPRIEAERFDKIFRLMEIVGKVFKILSSL